MDRRPRTLFLANRLARKGTLAFARMVAPLARVTNLVGAEIPEAEAAMVETIRRGLAGGIEWFVIAGGDGTLAVAANELVGTSAVLAALPAGTGNTLAWALSLPRRDSDWLAMAAQGFVDTMDVGLVQAGGQRRVFLNTVTIGLASTLAGRLTPTEKRRLGLLAWPRHLGSVLNQAPVVEVALLDASGTSDRFLTRLLVVVNGCGLAGPIVAGPPPMANQDGVLEVFALGEDSLGSMARVTVRVLLASHREDPAAHYQQASAFSLLARPAQPMDIDGESWGQTPARFSVLPRALSILLPERFASSAHLL